MGIVVIVIRAGHYCGWWCLMPSDITVYPQKYAHGFCFAVLCFGFTLTGFPISIRLTSLALWQFNDCPSASKATLTIMDKYFMWIHYKRLHNHNKAKHNKTVCIFLGIYCMRHHRTLLLASSDNDQYCGSWWLHIKYMYQAISCHKLESISIFPWRIHHIYQNMDWVLNTLTTYFLTV